MKLGLFYATCGVIVLACQLFEAATALVKTPVLWVIGVMFLVGGIATMIRSTRSVDSH